jgi:hypothetical protein
LGIPGDQAVGWVEELRASLPEAFERAAGSLPADARDEADRTAERIVAHVNRTWKPDLDRNPAHVMQGTSTTLRPDAVALSSVRGSGQDEGHGDPEQPDPASSNRSGT